MKVQSVTARRLGLGIVAIGATLLTSACATGQKAATSVEVPAIDGTQATVGKIDVRAISIQAPSWNSYGIGDSAGLTFVVINDGETDDDLTAITAPAFTSVSIVPPASAASTSAATSIDIKAGESVAFGVDPTGAQATLHALTATGAGVDKGLFPGETVSVTFSFKDAGSVTATVPVSLTDIANTASVPAG